MIADWKKFWQPCVIGTSLNPGKCKFGLEELSFMGHVLSKNGIRPTEEKVRAAKDAKRPKNVSEVRSFFGTGELLW